MYLTVRYILDVRNGLIWSNRYMLKKLYAKPDELATPRAELKSLGTVIPDFKLSKTIISKSE